MTLGTHNGIGRISAMSLAAGAAIGIASSAHAQMTSDQIIDTLEQQGFESSALQDDMKMYGILRDFTEDHPDFGILSGAAGDQNAGNVSFFADSNGKPVYLGTGNQVATQWRNALGQPIAPHLFDFSGYNPWPQGSGVYSTGTIDLGQGAVIDAYDSSVGDYDSTQASDGIIALQSTDAGAIETMQDGTIDANVLVGPGGDTTTVINEGGTGGVTGSTDTLLLAPDPLQQLPPADMGPVEGSFAWTGAIVLDRDLHANKLQLLDNAVVTIVGDVTIVVDSVFSMGEQAEIQIAPNSTLTMFTMDQVTAISQYAKVNVNTKDPSLVTFYHLGGQTFTLSQYTEVHATVYAPGAEVRITQEAELFGRVLAERVEIMQGGEVHIDKKLVQPVYACGNVVSDSPGSYSGAHAGAVTNINSFRQWFRNVPGVNVAEVQRLQMDGDGSGNFMTAFDDFNIADGRLAGSGTTDKNKYFTYEMVAVGQYNMCGEQFFEFTGAGDVYVMINDMLVIDLGGDSPSKNQIVELDRMGMADGELYTFRFFYAQRNGDGSQPFGIRTNMNFVFSDAEMPDSSGMYD